MNEQSECAVCGGALWVCESLLPKRMRVHRFRRDSANHLREAAVGLRSTCPCPRIPTSSILLRMC